jgi:hypothetical protein
VPAPEPPHAARLRAAVAAAEPRLLAADDAWTPRPRAPGKWSPRELVGHLIDSASNNHQRFVRARWQDDLVFPTYAQDDWVDAQGYADAPWRELVTLWAAYNRHLARVMAAAPAAVRGRAHARHNLDVVGWRPIAADGPATLDWLMGEYVDHLEHHMRQLLGEDWSP